MYITLCLTSVVQVDNIHGELVQRRRVLQNDLLHFLCHRGRHLAIMASQRLLALLVCLFAIEGVLVLGSSRTCGTQSKSLVLPQSGRAVNTASWMADMRDFNGNLTLQQVFFFFFFVTIVCP